MQEKDGCWVCYHRWFTGKAFVGDLRPDVENTVYTANFPKLGCEESKVKIIKKTNSNGDLVTPFYVTIYDKDPNSFVKSITLYKYKK